MNENIILNFTVVVDAEWSVKISGGLSTPITSQCDSDLEAITFARTHIHRAAVVAARDAHVQVSTPSDNYAIIIKPDGTTTEAPNQPPQPATSRDQPTPPVAVEGESEPAVANPEPTPPVATAGESEPATVIQFPTSKPASSRGRKLVQPTTPHRTWGMFASRRMARLEQLNRLSQTWPTPKTILVGNMKGGVGKTVLSVCLASAFGLARERDVVLLDNNPTGDLALRLDEGPNNLTVMDLIASLEQLENGSTRFSDVTNFLRHHQPGRFYGLVSRERAVSHTASGPQLFEPTISAADFARVHKLLSRYFSLIVVDGGNNDADKPWRASLEVCDQLVIPLEWVETSCKKAADLLATLEETGYPDIAANAIIVATSDGKAPTDRGARAYRHQFEHEWGHRVMELPPDPHLAMLKHTDWNKLRVQTRTAALSIASEIARSL